MTALAILMSIIGIFIAFKFWSLNVGQKNQKFTELCPSVIETQRATSYYNASSHLNLMSDIQLQGLLAQGTKLGSGYGDTLRIEVDGMPVFVKQIPLTDLERLPENMRSTRNIFDLPLFYQYGVGSAGFGAWRELTAHIMTTNWVLSGECPNFPLLYHWRILPREKPAPSTAQDLEHLKNAVAYWDESSTVRSRLEALRNAPATVTLFLEYIPEQLDDWLNKKIAEGDAVTQEALKMVFANLESISAFMHAHEFIHFDAHFRNILTDGKQLYLTDFGLALSTAFELSDEERAFFKQHHNYDLYYCIDQIVHTIINSKLASGNRTNPEEFMHLLRPFAEGKIDKTLPSFFQNLLSHYAQLAVIHAEFMHKLMSATKSTPYPASDLEAAYQDGLRK